MSFLREEILRDIQVEQQYQDAKWGTAFDDKNTLNDWVAYIARYLGKVDAPAYGLGTLNLAEVQKQLVKVAALAVAAIETLHRNKGFAPRHYDACLTVADATGYSETSKI